VSSRAWQLYLDDMLKFAQRVETNTHGFNQERFVDSRLTYDATLRNLELIGEAASHVPMEVQRKLLGGKLSLLAIE
jgi:uncharacterized protein with HEPN domain